MLIDTHIHTAPLSVCGQLRYNEIIDIYAAAGYGGLMLTNHYSKSYIEMNGISYKTWMEMYLAEYDDMAAYGKKMGVRVFLGAEVTLTKPYADYLVFGADKAFFHNNARLFDLTQPELYKLCHENDMLLVQAHPFRTEHGHSLQNPDFLDGIEINYHYGFEPFESRILATADKYGLMVTVGGDVHAIEDAARCGIEVPDDIMTSQDLAAYLKTVKRVKYITPASRK